MSLILLIWQICWCVTDWDVADIGGTMVYYIHILLHEASMKLACWISDHYLLPFMNVSRPTTRCCQWTCGKIYLFCNVYSFNISILHSVQHSTTLLKICIFALLCCAVDQIQSTAISKSLLRDSKKVYHWHKSSPLCCVWYCWYCQQPASS